MSAARSSASRRRQAGSILKNVNLAKVRSAIGVTIAARRRSAGRGAGARPSCREVDARPGSRQGDLPVERAGRRLGLSPGLLSAGLGSVPARADLSRHHARATGSSIRSTTPSFRPLGRDCSPGPAASLAPTPLRPTSSRASDSAPAEHACRGRSSVPRRRSDGELGLLEKVKRNPPPARPQPSSRSGPRDIRAGSALRGDDLLIAIERPPPGQERRAGDRDRRARVRRQPHLRQHPARRLRPLDRHRADDPRPLRRRGPVEMSGQPIRGRGGGRPGGGRIARRADGGDLRAARAGDRLQPAGLGCWCSGWRRGARPRRGWRAPAVRLVGLAVVYLPLVLLLGAALEPGGEGRNAAGDASARRCWRRLTLALLGGYRALAVARGADGPRLRGRRDRRLAAHLALAARPEPRPRGPLLRDRQRARGAAGGAGRRRHRGGAGRLRARACARARSAAAFLAAGLLAAFVFAAGRFGADVGAAIVLPLGAAVAAAASPARRRRAALLVGRRAARWRVALLALVDLLSGADAHLTRSVLDAGGLDDLADVAQRRLRALGAQLRAARSSSSSCRSWSPSPSLAVARRDRIARLAARPRRRCGRAWSAPSAATSSAPSPTTPARSCWRSATAYLLVFARLRLGRERIDRSGPADLPLALRAHRPRLAIFLDLPGRREPARGGACRGVPRSRPPRSRARPLRPARPAQPAAAPRRRRAARDPRLPDAAGAHDRASAPTAPSPTSRRSRARGRRRPRRELRRGDYDVVHVHEPMVAAGRLERGSGDRGARRSAPSTPTRPRRSPTTSPTCLGARRMFNRLSARIAVSEAAAWTGRRWFGGDYEIVPNGVDVDAAPQRPEAASARSCASSSSAAPRSARGCRSCSAPSAPWSSTCPAG